MKQVLKKKKLLFFNTFSYPVAAWDATHYNIKNWG